jgi:hypothetical protein
MGFKEGINWTSLAKGGDASDTSEMIPEWPAGGLAPAHYGPAGGIAPGLTRSPALARDRVACAPI